MPFTLYNCRSDLSKCLDDLISKRAFLISKLSADLDYSESSTIVDDCLYYVLDAFVAVSELLDLLSE